MSSRKSAPHRSPTAAKYPEPVFRGYSVTTTFKALVVRKSKDRKTYTRAIEARVIDDLPSGEVLIRVQYSSLNYKDGLSCLGNPGVTRRYPHTPGIDAAGVVASSESSAFMPGDQVVVVSQDLGMNTHGGFGQFIRVPAAWVTRLPSGLSLRESMIYGTAGFTAALALHRLLEHGVRADQGPAIITGATGGLGSIAVAVFAGQGFSVTASTGKVHATPFLRKLGAAEVVDRNTLVDDTNRPLLKETWACGVDTIGGQTLATVLRTCKEGASVAATGMVGSPSLPVSVFPFILRGVNLLGINAQASSPSLRDEIWRKLANEWKPAILNEIATDRSLERLNPEIDRILCGELCGRIVVDME